MQVALVGVGGVGGVVVDELLAADHAGTVRDAVALDTASADLDALEGVPRDRRVRIGDYPGGTGGDPELGARLLRAESGAVEAAVAGVPADVDALFVVAGLGGGTGGGCGPLLARSVAGATDVPVFGVAVLPSDDDPDASATRTAARALPRFVAGTDGLVALDGAAFPDATPDERVGILVERLGPLLAAGGDALPTADVVDALRAGVATLGYADAPADPDALAPDELTRLAQASTLSDLTLLATCASADRALAVATGPVDRIPTGALDDGAAWVGTHADVDAVPTGVVRGSDDRVGVLTVFAGVTGAPRVDRLRRVAGDDGDDAGRDPTPGPDVDSDAGSGRRERTAPDAAVPPNDAPPTLVVAPDATSGGRPHEGVATAVAAVEATLTEGTAGDLVPALADLGGQVVLVAGDVSDRAARTLAAAGIAAVSVAPDGFGAVARAVGATPVVDPRSLSGEALGTVAGVAVGSPGDGTAVAVECPDGEVLARAKRGGTVDTAAVATSSSSGSGPPSGDPTGDSGPADDSCPGGDSGSGVDPDPADDLVSADDPDSGPGPDPGADPGPADTTGVAGSEAPDSATTIEADPGVGPPSTVPTAPTGDVSAGAVRMGEYLGQTGRATVRAARTADGGRIAVKFPEFDDDTPDDTVRRAFRAVDAWAGIGDAEGVAAVLGRGVDPRPWVAVEYLDADCSDLGALPPAEAAWVAARVGAAVERAHRDGVVHLALHPGNVGLLGTPEGRFDVPRVTDWGLSRVLYDDAGAVGGFPPEYAAPEQLADGYGDLDAHTDVYQLGVVCYELFVGAPPFEGLSTGVVGKVLEERPTPPSARAPVPPAVDDALAPALAKEKGDRYADAGEFRAALAALSPYG